MLFGKKKDSPIPQAPDTQRVDDEMKLVTENLYKHNLEIAEKNKTLSLLGALYEISIQTLSQVELAGKITEIVQGAFDIERVAMISYHRVDDSATVVGSKESERFHKARGAVANFFDQTQVEHVTTHSVLGQIVKNKLMTHTDDLASIWGSALSAEEIETVKKESHAHSLVVYPLLINNEVVGFFALTLNRAYDALAEFERESLLSLMTVISVALGKAQLYEELTETNKKLAVANERLKEVDQLKNEFLSVASHQLRAPITAIKGYIANILEGSYGDVPEYLKNPLGVIEESVRIMISSIEDYLDVSRIEQGRMVYESGPVPFTQLAKRVVEELTPLAAAKSLSLIFADSPDVTITADIGKTKQVFSNLIDNAIKYTEKGSVTVSVSQEGDRVRFMTSDTGIGIDAKELPSLFEKFTRAKDANKVNTTGTGLGLYVAKNLVEGQKGTIRIESDGLGKGSRFIVELPMEAVPPKK
jgi:signal transduction histidine kinase